MHAFLLPVATNRHKHRLKNLAGQLCVQKCNVDADNEIGGRLCLFSITNRLGLHRLPGRRIA